MTQDLTSLDAHEQPSDRLRGIWKAISKSDQEELLKGPDVDDPRSPECLSQLRLAGSISADRISAAFEHVEDPSVTGESAIQDAPIYYHPMLPCMLGIPDGAARMSNLSQASSSSRTS